MMRTVAMWLAGIAFFTATARAEEPRLLALRTQNNGGRTYFQAQFMRPENLSWPRNWWTEQQVRQLAILPRLVPQDANTRNVYLQVDTQLERRNVLRFMGVWEGAGPAHFNLVYAVPAAKERAVEKGLVKLPAATESIVVPITLDFDKAQRVNLPAAA
ncbi:MAG: hypothetical protein AB7K24_14680, partial [Gemmataceae bacterium]